MIHFMKTKDILNGNVWSGPYCSKCKDVFYPSTFSKNYIVCPTCRRKYYYKDAFSLRNVAKFIKNALRGKL